jgi:FKBP-type peptidyl-prolyl cis-trans isomerase SlyD
MKMSKIEENKVAVVHYKGTFPEDGEEFDSSYDRDPLAFLIGHKQMIPGFEREMMGAKVGESRTFTLMPEDAYGEKSDDAVADIPREEFPEDIELDLGMVLMSDHGPFRIVAITNDIVKCDFNHVLAGRALKFEVEVVEVRDPSEEELAHGHVHGPGGHEH